MGSVERLTQYLSDLPSRATALAAGALSSVFQTYNDKENSLVLRSRLGQYHPSRLVLTVRAEIHWLNLVCATGTGEESWDVDRNSRTYVLHQITLRINNRSHGRFAAVSGAAKHDRTMTWW